MGDLRVSVTDHCNLRCRYCMPEEEYRWLPKETILSFEEIARLVAVFTSLGVRKVRLTGGEPLLRRELPKLVRAIAAQPGVADLAMTTNGVLLEAHAAELRAAGLRRCTVSLDTLRPDRFRGLTRRDTLDAVLRGVHALEGAGLTGTRLDTVVMRGVNDDELVDLLELARSVSAELRFIEYMDVGGATGWSIDKVVSKDEILETVRARYGGVEPLPRQGRSETALRYRLPDGLTFGVIASTTQPFCGSCNRSRLTADGTWLLCLYATRGVNLRDALRSGASDDALRQLIQDTWSGRADRGAEDRLALSQRGPSQSRATLREDPHLEMHTRGG